MCLHVNIVSYMLLKYNIFNVAFPVVMPFIPQSKDHGFSGWNFIKYINNRKGRGKELMDNGIITQAEFDAKKRELLKKN